ncbi:hypothetical protein [Streptomyces sp. ZSW22]|uniref:hypothetical protein n=1 Tax=Streptomyces sp. ZSW22 TaxID=3055050 RepID=UPI0025AEF4D7|nr:hypothetical protein [Streptomyces sp. ZSW22]MDN3244128.1 hypothetical protein [Streptomyces sp. ZSW22]
MTNRYRVTVTTDDRPLIHGWWDDETVARRKLISWIGEHGSRPGARVTLVDEETGTVLTEWPDLR